MPDRSNTTLQDLLATLETRMQAADQAECVAIISISERIKALAYEKMMHSRIVEGSHENLLDPQQVAARLNVPDSYVYDVARQGKLKTVRIGKYLRFTEDAVKEYRDKCSK
jgi:excisionase family DNA binding protein